MAFSDWRVQPLEMITDIVNTHKPDVILYAGDDLCRFVTLGNHLILKTPNHFLKVSYPGFRPLSNEQEDLLTSNFKKLIEYIKLPNNTILNKLNVPFFYINGNDDDILCINGEYYLRIHKDYILVDQEYFMIAETQKQKVTIRKGNARLHCYLNNPELAFDKEFLSLSTQEVKGIIYAPINPIFGKFIINRSEEKVSVFGYESEYGLGGDLVNNPKEYADIYLSHLPPLGKLDLSARYGTDHIGSKRLFEAIVQYCPKIVICGHSHIWGGFSERIGNTIVINVSSQDHYQHRWQGNYAVIDTGEWSVERHTKVDNQLRPVRGERSRSKKSIVRKESREWKEPKITRNIFLSPEKHMFVDVETGLAKGQETGKLWLIGLWFEGDLRQFLYPEEEKEFIDYLKLNGIASLVSWTRYDHKALRPILAKRRIDIKFLDACQRAANCVSWHDYSLVGLYKALISHNEQEDDYIPGHIAGLYADHLILSDEYCAHCPPKEELIARIKDKNRIDLLRMVEICRFLWNRFERQDSKVDIKNLTLEAFEAAVTNFRKAMDKRYRNRMRVEEMVRNYRRSLQQRIVEKE